MPAAEQLDRLLQIQVQVDLVRLQLFALQGASFQTTAPDRVTEHIGRVVARLLTEREDLYSSGTGVNLAGIAYDVLRTDVEATKRGIRGPIRSSVNQAARELWKGMDAYEADPAWASERRLDAMLLVRRAAWHSYNAMAAAPLINVMKPGVAAASIMGGALSLATLTKAGLPALQRLVAFMKGAKAEEGALAIAGAGASTTIRVVVASGEGLVLTTSEVAALVEAGALSAASLNLLMAVTSKPKPFVPKAFEEWAKSLPKKPINGDSPHVRYQIQHCGPEEFQVYSDGKEIGWADGLSLEDGYILDTKRIDNPKRSPYIEGSDFPKKVRAKLEAQELQQLRKYGAAVLDPSKPPVGIRIITNDPQAVPFFQALLSRAGIPGQVIVLP